MATDQRISPALAGLVVPIESLTPHPDNPRRGDVERLRESLRVHGQRRPLLADSAGQLVAGHHVYYAAQDEGWAEVAVVKDPGLDDPEVARRYLIADNRLSDLGGYDQDTLARVVEAVRDSVDGLAGTGYTPEELDDLIRSMQPTPLDELAGAAGPPGEELFWPVIRVKVTPEVHGRYLEVIGDYGDGDADETARFTAWVEAAWEVRPSAASPAS